MTRRVSMRSNTVHVLRPTDVPSVIGFTTDLGARLLIEKAFGAPFIISVERK